MSGIISRMYAVQWRTSSAVLTLRCIRPSHGRTACQASGHLHGALWRPEAPSVGEVRPSPPCTVRLLHGQRGGSSVREEVRPSPPCTVRRLHGQRGGGSSVREEVRPSPPCTVRLLHGQRGGSSVREEVHLSPSCTVRRLHGQRGGSSAREERWRRRDGVPAGYRLVYVAPMEGYVRAAAAAVSAPLLLAVPAVFVLPLTPQVASAGALSSLVAAGVLLLARRFPFRMYHSAARRQFCAVLAGWLALNSRHMLLPEGSVRRAAAESGLAPWTKVLYTSPGGKLILFDEAFQSPDVYHTLLGEGPQQGGEGKT